MIVLLAVVAVAGIVWMLLPLFKEAGKPEKRKQPAVEIAHQRDAADTIRKAIEDLETDFAEGKVDSEGFGRAREELTARLAEIEKASGRGA